MDYVVAAANLYGQIFGISGTRDRASITKTLEKVRLPFFTPKSSVKIHLSDEEMEEDKQDDASKIDFIADTFGYYITFSHFLNSFPAPEKAELEEWKGKLASSSVESSFMQMYPIDFEKVRHERIDTLAAYSAEATDRLAAECSQGAGSKSMAAFRLRFFFPPSPLGPR